MDYHNAASDKALYDKAYDCWERTASHAFPDGKQKEPAFKMTFHIYEHDEKRHYHSIQHVLDLLEELEAVEQGMSYRLLVYLAAWYHDVIYNPKKHDNEERSANWAVFSLAKESYLDQEYIKKVKAYILATKTHLVPKECLEEERFGLQALLDADLSVLGKPPEDYRRYVSAIQREYAHVSEAEFQKGRLGFCEGMLARKRIYQTGHFHDKYEESARSNLAQEAEFLRKTL